MKRLIATFYKEFLVLSRDRAGLALLFIMPVVLITIMALIQDAPFRDYQELKVDVLWVDEDSTQFSEQLKDGLLESNRFRLVMKRDKVFLTKDEAIALTSKGEYTFAVVIPKGSEDEVSKRSGAVVSRLLYSMGMPVDTGVELKEPQRSIQIYFDPASKLAFRSAMKNGIDRLIARIESSMILESIRYQLSGDTSASGNGGSLEQIRFIGLEEQSANPEKRESVLQSNSVQHNVPAWTIFAMFFIVIPLGGALLKEREDGSLLRMKMLPGSYLLLLGGKVLFYVCVCLIQFALMMLVGLFFMPVIGLPALVINGHLMSLLIVAIGISFAATCYGILVGSVFRTPSQSLTFGSISVVLMSAIGGIWIPTEVMPQNLQVLSRLSPMNWGLEAVNNLFLRQLGLADNWLLVCGLMIFGSISLLIAYMVELRMQE